MELRQLEYFVAVAEVGTYLGAAESLEVAQPSLWRTVKSLEAELGLALFERSGRGVQITNAGTQLLARATQVLEHANALKQLGRELRRGEAGMITLACASPQIPRFVAPLVGRFYKEHPRIHVSLNESPGLPVVDHVFEGATDFVTSLPRNDRRLDGRRIGEARAVVVVADDHPWRHREVINLQELEGVPVMVGGPQTLSRRLIDPALRALGIELEVIFDSKPTSTAIAIARAGIGVAVVGDDILPGGPLDGWPVLVDDHHELTTPIWIYWRRNRPHEDAASRLFIQFLDRDLADQVGKK